MRHSSGMEPHALIWYGRNVGVVSQIEDQYTSVRQQEGWGDETGSWNWKSKDTLKHT